MVATACTSSVPTPETSTDATVEPGGGMPVANNPEVAQTPISTAVAEPGPRVAVGWAEVQPNTPDPTRERMKALRVLAQEGQLDEALTGLGGVLEADLPRHRLAVLTADVWAGVRAKPKFDELLAKTTDAYQDALEHGVPAFVFTPRDGWLVEEDGGRDPQTPYQGLRIGVYDHELRRFVPIVPPVPRAFSGVFDHDRGLAIVARGNLEMKSMWTVQPDRCRALVFSLDRFGELVFEARGVSTSGDLDSHGFVLRLGDSGPPPLYVERISVDYYEDQYFEWTAKGGKKVGWQGEFSSRTPKKFPFGRPYLSVVEIAEAGYIGPEMDPAIKYTRNEKLVLGDVTVKLDRGHGNSFIEVSPDPKILAVVTRAEEFSSGAYDGEGPLPEGMQDRHVVDLVDMHEGTVTRLAKGPGYVHVAWAPDGTLFFETPTRTARVPKGSATPIDDVLSGVHFGTPPFPEEGGV